MRPDEYQSRCPIVQLTLDRLSVWYFLCRPNPIETITVCMCRYANSIPLMLRMIQPINVQYITFFLCWVTICVSGFSAWHLEGTDSGLLFTNSCVCGQDGSLIRLIAYVCVCVCLCFCFLSPWTPISVSLVTFFPYSPHFDCVLWFDWKASNDPIFNGCSLKVLLLFFVFLYVRILSHPTYIDQFFVCLLLLLILLLLLLCVVSNWLYGVNEIDRLDSINHCFHVLTTHNWPILYIYGKQWFHSTI